MGPGRVIGQPLIEMKKVEFSFLTSFEAFKMHLLWRESTRISISN